MLYKTWNRLIIIIITAHYKLIFPKFLQVSKQQVDKVLLNFENFRWSLQLSQNIMRLHPDFSHFFSDFNMATTSID